MRDQSSRAELAVLYIWPRTRFFTSCKKIINIYTYTDCELMRDQSSRAELAVLYDPVPDFIIYQVQEDHYTYTVYMSCFQHENEFNNIID